MADKLSCISIMNIIMPYAPIIHIKCIKDT